MKLWESAAVMLRWVLSSGDRVLRFQSVMLWLAALGVVAWWVVRQVG